MEKFIVSARKYRPQNFGTVVGQAHITTTLKNAIKNNQLAHAFLFTGPRGVGKTTCARILAKTINCENKTPEAEACNECTSCKNFETGSSFNIHELDAASNNSVDDIRSLVEQVRFAPQAGSYKVYIVDEVHMLSTAAFNAFLKTLEEPPSYAIFILATTEKHKILPTILSRCQIFDFKRITNRDTVEHLQEICTKEHISAEPTALHLIAQKSEGCMRDSLSILDKIVSFTGGQLDYSNTLEHLNILDEDYYFKLLQHMQQQQLSDALLLFDEINAKGFEGDIVLEGFAEFLRNVLVSTDAKAASLLHVADDFKDKYVSTAASINGAWVLGALNITTEALMRYQQAKNKRLHVEFALIKLCHLSQAVEIVADGQGIVKKKIVDVVKALNFKAIPNFAPIPITTTNQAVGVKQNIPAQTTAINEKPAQLIVETSKEETIPTIVESPNLAPIQIVAPKTNLTSLAALRQQARQTLVKQVAALPLSQDLLDAVINDIIAELEQNENALGASNFKNAKTRILSDTNFEIVTLVKIQRLFIEEHKNTLIEKLAKTFNNKEITFEVVFEGVEEPEEIKIVKTSRQIFEELSMLYPNIKVLKDTLKLDIE
jgi:DNA polymerase III subunit gamma/tau